MSKIKKIYTGDSNNFKGYSYDALSDKLPEFEGLKINNTELLTETDGTLTIINSDGVVKNVLTQDVTTGSENADVKIINTNLSIETSANAFQPLQNETITSTLNENKGRYIIQVDFEVNDNTHIEEYRAITDSGLDNYRVQVYEIATLEPSDLSSWNNLGSYWRTKQTIFQTRTKNEVLSERGLLSGDYNLSASTVSLNLLPKGLSYYAGKKYRMLISADNEFTLKGSNSIPDPVNGGTQGFPYVERSFRTFSTATIVDSETVRESALSNYDLFVCPTYTGGNSDGTALKPYINLETAIANSNDGDSILVDGVNIISSEIVLPHSLFFYGTDQAEIKFASYNATNGDIFSFEGDNTQKFLFKNLRFANAGGYGLYIKKTLQTKVVDCTITNCGWDGTQLHTIASKSVTGIYGYDSTQAELQAFWASSSTSDGGAMRIQEATQVEIINNNVSKNLRGIRLQDCGVGGYGFVTRNVSSQNIESGIYLAAGSTYYGCQNIIVTINSSAYNANNGLLCIGGINNKFSQNEVNGNWNAGMCGWGSANLTLRDCGLYDNNRSTYNGIGNTGDAKASIQINDAYNLLGTAITYNPAFRFIAEILDTQVHYTGLGSNTEKIGFLITSGVGAIADNAKNIIKVDDVGFIGQDYAIDFSEVDLTNLRVSLGDNSYQSIGLKAVKAPLSGNYSELPFSNHVMEVPEVDVVVDTLKQTIALHEGVGGNVINVYNTNELQSVLKTNSVDIIQKSSDKIQLRDLTLGNVYINGVVAGSNINTVNDSLNGAFSMDLTEYKEFIETEVGVIGGGTTSATFYYIESPDGTYHYPLFKTEAEADQIDTDLGGTGSSHTHTYVDDLTNTTWYMPDVSNHMNSSVMPVNGLYTAPNGGTAPNVIWNIQVTDVDTNYTPTFTDLTFTVAEQSAVNLVYKPAGDTDTYNVTGVPTGYADTGYAIVGTAETITDGIDIVHTLSVTKANAFGSDTGTITFTVTDDPSNNVSNNSTNWTKALHFGRGGGYSAASHLRQVHNHQDFNVLRHNGTSTTVGLPDQAGMMARSVAARPWATSVVFKADGNNINQHIWQQGNGSGGNGNHIYLRLNSIGKLYFGWGKTGVGVNECLIATNISSSTWYGVYIASNGARLAAGNNQYAQSPYQAADVNLAASFDIRIMSSADNFASVGSNLSTASNWVSTGIATSESTGGSFHIGSANGQKYFYGKVASMVVTALRITEYANTQIPMPSDAEIKKMITDPKGWEDDYRDGELVRSYVGVNTGTYTPNDYVHGYISNMIYLMGDGTNDSFGNGIRNQVRPGEQNIVKMQLNNMISSDIVNVTIPGLS